MEHVEVLRDLSEVCRAAIKAGDWKVDGACDPDSLLRHADAAIASLSAPQPPAEAQPERYACNGPEGTFWTDDAALANKLIGAAFDRDEWTVTDTQNPTGAAPPPSAPVGVEGLDAAAVEAGHITFASMKQCADAWFAVVDALNAAAPGWNEKKGTGRECATAAIAALAQQPAASKPRATRADPHFTNTGNSEADFIADDAIACTACGGSGHRDDQQPAAVDGDNPYPAPRNRQEAAALAKLALAYLGVTSAHIDAVVARCETDLAAQPGGSDNDH